MLTSEKIEQVFVDLLQRKIKIVHENKTIKFGKLLLVSKKNAQVAFTMLNPKNEPKTYEIPYPFGYDYDESRLVVNFDYTIDKLCNNKACLTNEILALLPTKTGRFLNKKIKIIAVD